MVELQIFVESQFRLTDDAEIFAAKVHAIKEAIADIHQRAAVWPHVQARNHN